MHKNYYEAILQVRPRTSPIEKFIEGAFKDTDKAHLVKKKILKTGVDYYISSWKFALPLGNLLVRRFGGNVNLSRKIFGRSRKKGHVVYRSTIIYRASPFTKYEILAHGNTIVRITSVGKTIVGKNLLSGKKSQVDTKIEWEKLSIHKTHIISIYPHLEVINPEDYQGISVHNPRKVHIDEKVKVVLYRGMAYLVD